MRILLNNYHIPHAYMMATAMPEHDFWVAVWSNLRPIPENVTVMEGEEWRGMRFDAAIDDAKECWTFEAKVRKRIFLEHCETDLGQPEILESLTNRLEQCDYGVTVSQHKRATMRDLGFNSRIRVIPFGFSPYQWPQVKERGGLVTTVHNRPAIEVIDFWKIISDGFECQTIGNWTEPPDSTNYFHPESWDEQKEAMSNASIYVNVVTGHSFGMSPLEAMMMGIPMITGMSPEAWQWALDGWNCCISCDAPMNSVEWIRDRIRWLQENPKRADEIGYYGRETVLNMFSFRSLNEAWNNLLFST